MERKRIARRFAVENEGEPAKKRAAAIPQAKEAKEESIQHPKVLTKAGELDQSDAPAKTRRQGKTLVALLLQSFKKKLRARTAP